MSYQHVQMPNVGTKLSILDGKLSVPDRPILGFIEGDGIGPDISRTMLRVIDSAVEKAYGGQKKIEWCELFWVKKLVTYTTETIFQTKPLMRYVILLLQSKAL